MRLTMVALSLSVALAASPGLGQDQVKSGRRWAPAQAKSERYQRINGAALISKDIKRATIGPAKLSGAFRAVESSPNSVLSDSEISNIVATDLVRDCIRLRSANHVVISNVVCRHADTPNRPPDLPEGLAIKSGTDIVVKDSEFSGFQMQMDPGRYWNGDGIAAEAGVDGLRIERVLVANNTDAGLDLKAKNVFLDQVTSRGNARNFRFWSSVDAGTLISEEPIRRGGSTGLHHIWVMAAGGPKTIHIKNLIIRSSVPAVLFTSEGGFTTFLIDNCDISTPAGTRTLMGLGKVISGPGCTLKP